MRNFFIATGVIYAVVLCFQMLSCAHSIKQAEVKIREEKPLDSSLMTARSLIDGKQTTNLSANLR